MAVHHDGRIRLLLAKHPVDRHGDAPHIRLVPASVRIDRGIARREKQGVSLAKRYVERFCQIE